MRNNSTRHVLPMEEVVKQWLEEGEEEEAEEEVVEDAVVEASAFGRSKLIRKPEKNLVKRVQEMKVIREREINAQKGTCSETLNLSR